MRKTTQLLILVILLSCSGEKSANQQIKKISLEKKSIKEYFDVYKSNNDSFALLMVERKLDSLFSLNIHDKELYQIKGELLRQTNKYEEFAKLMEESTDYFPENPQSYFGAGLAYDKIGKHKKALQMYKMSIDSYDKIILKYPSLNNYINRAMSYSFYKSKADGIIEFEKIKKSNLFDSTTVIAYQPMFYSFNKKKFIEDAFLN